tara:strand:- start:195 stop:485 length:291 start_codon:yes stop_codon:yes gene_type:complete
MLTLGQVVTTASIANAMSTNLEFRLFIIESVEKHLNHDFGAVCKEDHDANVLAIRDGSRVFSMYLIPEELGIIEEKIYVITEADRSCTTTLFPCEY